MTNFNLIAAIILTHEFFSDRQSPHRTIKWKQRKQENDINTSTKSTSVIAHHFLPLHCTYTAVYTTAERVWWRKI